LFAFVNATANTGNGGSSSGYTGNGYAGGSGIVIVRYLTEAQQAFGFTVTGGTITTSGEWRIHTFTSSSSLVIS
jgi:hypothetical protein